ncbi:hypothetical protein MRX96_024652 [Rhipicephalus microplus]
MSRVRGRPLLRERGATGDEKNEDRRLKRREKGRKGVENGDGSLIGEKRMESEGLEEDGRGWSMRRRAFSSPASGDMRRERKGKGVEKDERFSLSLSLTSSASSSPCRCSPSSVFPALPATFAWVTGLPPRASERNRRIRERRLVLPVSWRDGGGLVHCRPLRLLSAGVGATAGWLASRRRPPSIFFFSFFCRLKKGARRWAPPPSLGV